MRSLSHATSAIRLELTEDSTLLVSGRQHRIDRVSGAILRLMIRDHPRVLSRQSISAVLHEHHLAGDGINKAISELRAELVRGAVPDLVKTVHREGYCVSDSWNVEDISLWDAAITSALQEIVSLCHDVEASLLKLRYTTSKSGAQYVVPAPGLANEFFQRLNSSGWSLIHALSVLQSANGSLILRLKAELFQLASYVTFWRIGTRYEEEEWKEEFRVEMNAHLDLIQILVTHIVEGKTRLNLKSSREVPELQYAKA